MEKLLQMSIAADFFMLQLIAIGDENSTKFRLPQSLKNVYQEICDSVEAKVSFIEDDEDKDVFQLVFTNLKEQDKVWERLYEFNHSGQRTFPIPNIYDQSNGELRNSKLDDFLNSAIQELKNPSHQFLFLFSFFDATIQLDGPELNKNFKNILGTEIKYVMLWDEAKKQPLAIMIQGERDLIALAKEFDKHALWGKDTMMLPVAHVEIASKFGFEDLDFWDIAASKMASI